MLTIIPRPALLAHVFLPQFLVCNRIFGALESHSANAWGGNLLPHLQNTHDSNSSSQLCGPGLVPWGPGLFKGQLPQLPRKIGIYIFLYSLIYALTHIFLAQCDSFRSCSLGGLEHSSLFYCHSSTLRPIFLTLLPCTTPQGQVQAVFQLLQAMWLAARMSTLVRQKFAPSLIHSFILTI